MVGPRGELAHLGGPGGWLAGLRCTWRGGPRLALRRMRVRGCPGLDGWDRGILGGGGDKMPGHAYARCSVLQCQLISPLASTRRHRLDTPVSKHHLPAGQRSHAASHCCCCRRLRSSRVAPARPPLLMVPCDHHHEAESPPSMGRAGQSQCCEAPVASMAISAARPLPSGQRSGVGPNSPRCGPRVIRGAATAVASGGRQLIAGSHARALELQLVAHATSPTCNSPRCLAGLL